MQSTSYLRSTRKRLSIVYQYKQALMKDEQVHKKKQGFVSNFLHTNCYGMSCEKSQDRCRSQKIKRVL